MDSAARSHEADGGEGRGANWLPVDTPDYLDRDGPPDGYDLDWGPPAEHPGDAAEPADLAAREREIFDGLTDAQIQAVVRDGPVLALAGAGTGKTKTLTRAVAHRIAIRGTPARKILAVTFTNKAAGEMRGRIEGALGAPPSWIGTFHGLGARQLRDHPELAGLRPGFDIVDADDSRRLVKRVMQAMNLSGDDTGGLGRDPIKAVANRVSTMKDRLVSPEEARAHADAEISHAKAARRPVDPEGLRVAASVYPRYQQALRDANAADFGDLLLWTTRAMRDDRGFRARWAGRFDAVFADEYQDVNHAQYTWLRLLAADHGQIFVVGDDDQAIFGWRGADIGYIRRFVADFPDAAKIRLEENFRSTGHILTAANAVIARDGDRIGKTLFTRKPDGHLVEVVAYRNAADEATGLVGEMVRCHAAGAGWDEMAMLYRGNALSRGFEEALMHARVPYVLVGDVGFYQRAEIKGALALLRLATTPDDAQSDEALRRVVNTPARGFGAKAIDALQDEAAFRQVSLLRALETADLPPKTRSAGLAFADAVRGHGRDDTALTLADHISVLLEATGYRKMLRESRAESTEDRLENVAELIQLAQTFNTARELLDHAALSTGGPSEAGDEPRVRLMSMHRAKGLEFPHVFLPAWETGVFPPDYGDPAEERRLAYVALTRGMRRVTISYCAWRRGEGRPSPFIADIPEANRVFGWLRSARGGRRAENLERTGNDGTRLAWSPHARPTRIR